MSHDLVRHDALLREVVRLHDGRVFNTVGDAVCAVFPTADAAIRGALDGQARLANESWQVAGGIAVRMSNHTGEAEEREEDYFGPTLSRVARLLSSAHGGQVVVSAATRELVQGAAAEHAEWEDLGEH